jgi:CRISPR-associated protein (TIGR03986 family)
MVKSGAIQEYDPKVLLPAKDGRPARSFRPIGRIPGGVADGDRVAALVNIQPIVHRFNRFQWFSVEQIASATGHTTLGASASQRKVFGYLHLTGPNIENKHDERLFFRWDDVNPAPRTGYKPEDVQIDAAVIDEYNRSLARYWERHGEVVEQLAGQPPSATNLPFPSSFVKKDRKLRQGDLVYYHKAPDGSQHIYPVAIPRREYRFPREALLPKHVCRCKNLQTLCLACRTFGWVHEEADDDRTQQIAYAGRVRFSLGTLKNETTMQYLEADPDGIALAILGTPKPTTTLFYLLQSNGKPASSSTNYNDPNSRLRGRKFYRHWGGWDTLPARQKQEYRRAGNERDKQNRTLFEVLAPGAHFTFQVKFENLQPVELGALLWSLQLEDGMFHRLGFAKPLGFGSVKICVTEVAILPMATRYNSLLSSGDNEAEQAQSDPQTPSPDLKTWISTFVAQMEAVYCKKGEAFGNLTNIADLKALLSAPKISLPIHYPRQSADASTDGENFKWFMGNKRRAQRETRNQLPAPQPLSLAIDDHVGLTLMDEKGNPL